MASTSNGRDERHLRQAWLRASSELIGLFLGDVDDENALRAVIRRLREVSDADICAISRLDPTAPDTTFHMVVEGEGRQESSILTLPRRSLMTRALETGGIIVSDDLGHDAATDPLPEWADQLGTIGVGMFVPLISEGEALGVLFAGWQRGSASERTARDDLQLIQVFADQAALALRRGRGREGRIRRQRWLEATSELIRTLTGEIDRDQALRMVIHRLRDVSGADYAAITLLDPFGKEGTVIELLEGFSETDLDNLGARHVSHVRIPRKGLTDRVLATGEAIVSADFTKLPGYRPSPELVEPLADVGLGMLVPLLADGDVLGVLFAAWRRGSPDEEFAKGEVPLIETFADEAALALRQVRAQDERTRREQWLEATADMARLLVGEVERDEAMSLVIRRLRRISGADFGGIILIDPSDHESLVVPVFEGVGMPAVPADMRIPRQGLVARVIESGNLIVSHDYPNEPGHNPPPTWAAALSTIGLGMVMPLAPDHEVIGVLFAGWRRGSPHERLAAAEAPQVQTFADLAALALERVKAQDDHNHLLLLQDREAIAHNLHDAVLQRLFAVGLHLQSASQLTTQPRVQHRVRSALDDLEHTTQRVRSTIRQLSGKHDDDSSGPLRSPSLESPGSSGPPT